MSKTQSTKSFLQDIFSATKLTGQGSLAEATKLIQHTLLGKDAPNAPRHAQSAPPRSQPTAPGAGKFWSSTLPGQTHTVVEDVPYTTTPPIAEPAHFELVDEPAPAHPASTGTPVTAPSLTRPSFTRHTFSFEGEQYPYRLYVPAALQGDTQVAAALPLVVLLHGCTQNAQDFARGTTMNTLADVHQCIVLYPEQIAKSNSQRCWNWFEPGHQQLDHGEPGMIAALTKKILAEDHQGRHADTQRVYIAGLSAGGAMAAVVAALYPDLFAALGVHSGLAAGAAKDLMSAFNAMRMGAKGRGAPALPTIVFHGTADKTVHPDNADYITDAALSALTADGLKLVKSSSVIGGANQKTERTVYSATNGPSYVEHWLVDAGPHAWSGGDPTGSYTDPGGPSASAAMLAFFLQHPRG